EQIRVGRFRNCTSRRKRQQSLRGQLLIEAEGRNQAFSQGLTTRRGRRDRRQPLVGRNKKIADRSVLQHGRDEGQAGEYRLVVDAAAATYHCSPVTERIVGEAEARTEIIVVARRPRWQQIVVVAQTVAQVQIRSRLESVLQVEAEISSVKLRVRIAEALIDRAREAETRLLDDGQRLICNHRGKVRPSQPGEFRDELTCRAGAQHLVQYKAQRYW